MNNNLNQTQTLPNIGSFFTGMSFVDVLLRTILENGISGISFSFIVCLWLTNSMEDVKGLIKKGNELLWYYISIYSKQYGSVLWDYTKNKFVELKERQKISILPYLQEYSQKNNKMKIFIPSILGIVAEWFVINSLLVNVLIAATVFYFLYSLSYEKTITNEKKIEKIDTEKKELQKIEKRNKVTVMIDNANKADMMYLGNWILKKKSELKEFKNYVRLSSDKYKVTEIYNLPKSFSFPLSTNPTKVEMEVYQSVNMSLEVEQNEKIELIKNVMIEQPKKKSVKEIGLQSINNTKQYYNYIPEYHMNVGKTIYIVDPRNLFNGYLADLLLYCGYTKNKQLLQTLYDFVTIEGKELHLDGEKYKLRKNDLGAISLSQLKNKGVMDQFLKDMETYWTKELIPTLEAKVNKNELEEWVKSLDGCLEPIPENPNPVISITFSSEEQNENQLTILSRNFFRTIQEEYYNQQTGNEKKISVYQMNIKYKIIKETKPNPEYEEWQKTHGKEEEEKKEEKKEEEKEEEKEKENEKEDKKDRKKKPKISKRLGLEENDFWSSYYDRPPPQTITEEIKQAYCETHHIKTDQKPFQYLYLQKETKELLNDYLLTFKHKKSQYEKFGIPYKGGILLTGEPGCGKSSTIMAIATFLNKDIFYLDLSKIKTNHELKVCVDHIRTNSKNGGLIIFEDIDCMTSIVHSRENETNVNKAINGDDPLSLSFLLNIIDGSLAPEDVLFVITTNHLEKLDKALVRPGRMDISIEIKKCDRYQLSQIYKDLYEKTIPRDYLLRFEENKFPTAEVILHLFHNTYNKEKSEEEILSRFLC